MITKEQFEEIKQYVLRRHSFEHPFSMHPNDFCREFGLTKPFYEDLKKLNIENGMPFSTKGSYFDRFGDPSDPILFFRE